MSEKSKSSSWGLCVNCKWWQIEPDASVDPHTVGVCIDEKLQKFRLRISGNGGCTRFQSGKPARLKGSSDQPPTEEVAR